jgi:hypothetical protein
MWLVRPKHVCFRSDIIDHEKLAEMKGFVCLIHPGYWNDLCNQNAAFYANVVVRTL